MTNLQSLDAPYEDIRTNLPPEAGSERLPNLYFRDIVLPWNVLSIMFTYQFQRFRWMPGIFPEITVFQDTHDDKRLIDEGDDLHTSS